MKNELKKMFYILKFYQCNKEDYFTFIDILKDLYSEKNFEVYQDYIILKSVLNKTDLIDIVENLKSDLYLNILCFVGEIVDEEYIEFICQKLDLISYDSNYGLLNESELLRLCIKESFDELTKKRILRKYYYDTEMKKTIKAFLECNMNTLKTSEILYMHRNTLINRINKFIETTGYDVRDFKEAVIIYHLLK